MCIVCLGACVLYIYVCIEKSILASVYILVQYVQMGFMGSRGYKAC